MRVGIIQSGYLPWRGYFDFIHGVDLFVIYDDVQFTRRDWRTRNRIKTPHGVQWLSVPVRYQPRGHRIDETEIDYQQDWRSDHRHRVSLHLRKAPFLDRALSVLDAAFAVEHRTITELNVALIRGVCAHLCIQTPIRLSSELVATGAKTDRLLSLLAAVGGTTYVSGPTAKTYLDEEQFRREGVRLEYKSYVYPPYPQLWGDFDGAVSIIDLIANCGPRSRDYLTSLGENELAVA